MKTKPKLKAPKHLKSETRLWWESVVSEFELEPHHVRILVLAAGVWDRCTEAREILDREGLTFVDRFGQPVSRPEVAIERDSRIAFARLIRELDLDTDPPRQSGRPPRLGR